MSLSLRLVFKAECTCSICGKTEITEVGNYKEAIDFYTNYGWVENDEVWSHVSCKKEE